MRKIIPYIGTYTCTFFVAVIFVLLFSIVDANAQHARTIQLSLVDSTQLSEFRSIEKELLNQKTVRDSSSALHELEKVIQKLNSAGFLSASIDEISYHHDTIRAAVYMGPGFEWASLGKGNVEDEFLTGSGFRAKLFKGKIIRPDQLRQIRETILNNCENNGYPFAVFRLDSLQFNDHSLSANLHLDKNQLYHIDSVIVKGSATISEAYLYNYISIRPGDVYNESYIRRISNRLRELPFVREIKPYVVQFGRKDATLYLYLEDKKSSQFDGVIGFLPDENNKSKLNVTGEVHLKLQNSLKRGEIIELNWRQIPPKSQDLKVNGLYPFLFQTPLGLDASLALFRKDTIYVDVTKNIGLQYALTGTNYLKVFINDKESDLQSTKGLENITVLPAYADIEVLSYGIEFQFEKLDYRPNPRNGFQFKISGSIGNRNIKRNSAINPEVYDSLDLKTTQYNGAMQFDYYFALGNRQVLNAGFAGARMHNSPIFTNELYRIGGLRSLRGFDEESIYASTYGIGKLEFRYLLEQNSFLFLFFNGAWYENKAGTGYITDTPFGFGTGINFETRLGIFSLSYALGKQFNNPIFVKNAKIHFGIVNYF